MDVAAVAAVIASAGSLITAVVGAYVVYTQRGVRREVKQVHRMVNQQRTDAARYTADLIAALQQHGIDVPDDQSLNNN